MHHALREHDELEPCSDANCAQGGVFHMQAHNVAQEVPLCCEIRPMRSGLCAPEGGTYETADQFKRRALPQDMTMSHECAEVP